jgi:fatty-acyl-CoA synthase
MLSYAHGVAETALLGRTIGDDLTATVAIHGDAPALVSVAQDVRLSYRELDRAVDDVAGALMAAGVKKGDRVGVWSTNCVEWVLVQYGTARIGAILVTINPAYRSSELRYVLDQSGCTLLFSALGFRDADYRQILDEVRGALPSLAQVVYFGTPDWTDFVAGGRDVTADELAARSATLSFDDPINIQYTSGTTGFPKGATLSHHNILNNGYFVAERCRYTAADRVCIPVPFYHCFGMVMGNLGCTSHGACMVIPGPSFDPGQTLAAVEGERCTSLYGVPTMFIAELGLPDFARYDLTSLRTGIMAGSPCPVEIMRQVVERMHMSEVTICYGMTETSPVSTQSLPGDDLERRVTTVGRVHPHVEIKVVDPGTGLVVSAGEPGELCTRGYSVMLGYWNAPDQTAAAVDRAGWMHTGDLATMDAAGYVNVVGRIKDVIIRGGENIYPREIEEFLLTHAEIADAQVFGVPDDRYGEVPAAWIVPRPESQLDVESVLGFCAGRIAHYKVPRHVKVVDGFPMTVTGKVQKFKMREAYVAELGLGAAERVTA